ncbi:hypothetical protein [Brotaphodocola sp.]|uniref:hypothetical protein n=1 Tax=Brotaphodocola sp. TaxID=3073577 RepID=UPI003D7C678D
MRKRITGLLTVAMAMTMTFSAYAGEWIMEGDNFQYKNDSGSYARDQYMVIDGATYGFDANAYMIKGWNQKDSKYYYFDPESGVQQTGWKQVDGNWYYLNPNLSNAMQTSWLKLGNSLYYFHPDGHMQPGNTTFFADGFGYETKENGEIKRNMSEEKGDGVTMIYEDNGKMKYRNATTITTNAAAGSDVYVYWMEGSQNTQIIDDTKQTLRESVTEKKEDLYQEYLKKVRSVTKSKKRATRRAKWEDKVKRNLQEMKVSDEEIQDYIYDVESGSYNGKERDYEEDEYDSYYDD